MALQAPLRMGRREWASLAILSVAWGGSFLFYKLLVAELPVLTVVFGRLALAALVLHAVVLARGSRMPADRRLWLRFLLLGLVNNAVPFTLIAFGETRIASGLASILNATTPLFTVLAAHVATADEKLNGGKLAGVALGFLGVVVLIGVPAEAGASHAGVIGELAILGAALAYAVGSLYGRAFRSLPPLEVATGQVTGATLILLPATMMVDRPWSLAPPSSTAWAALAALAVVCTAFAYLLFFRVLAVAGATNLVLVTFLVPVSALVLGALLLGEPVRSQALAGMALIACGLACIDGRPWRLVTGRAGPGREPEGLRVPPAGPQGR